MTVTIRVDGVSHRYGERLVLDGIDLDLHQARIGIVGANGSGKSTLARMFNGLVHPTTGRVTVDGLDTARHGNRVRRTVGFVFTDPDNQIVMPTVAEDVAFSLRRSGLSRVEIATATTSMLELIGLADYADHPTHMLSGGQKQLVALAAVLVREPDVVVADEPTTLLDLRNAVAMQQALRRWCRQVIVVTHQLEMVHDFDRVIVLDAGRVVADDEPAPALKHYRSLMGCEP